MFFENHLLFQTGSFKLWDSPKVSNNLWFCNSQHKQGVQHFLSPILGSIKVSANMRLLPCLSLHLLLCPVMTVPGLHCTIGSARKHRNGYWYVLYGAQGAVSWTGIEIVLLSTLSRYWTLTHFIFWCIWICTIASPLSKTGKNGADISLLGKIYFIKNIQIDVYVSLFPIAGGNTLIPI